MPRWTSDLETGYQDLDDQHRKALRLLDIAGDAVEAKLDRRSVVIILDETYDYFLRHTNMEEELMVTFNYPELDTHQKEHQSMLVEMRRLSEDYAAHGHRSIITVKLRTMMARWIRDHILLVDKKMTRFLLSQVGR